MTSILHFYSNSQETWLKKVESGLKWHQSCILTAPMKDLLTRFCFRSTNQKWPSVRCWSRTKRWRSVESNGPYTVITENPSASDGQLLVYYSSSSTKLSSFPETSGFLVHSFPMDSFINDVTFVSSVFLLFES